MILVTGASGLLGSRLVFELLRMGHTVRAMGRSAQTPDALWRYHFKGKEHLLENLEWFQGDIANRHSVLDALEGVIHVYHCAGLVSFIPIDRQLLRDINVRGTANIVDGCLVKGIGKLCHVSSVAALGRSLHGKYDEESIWNPDDPHSQYAISKYDAECEVWRGVAEGLNAVIVNPGIIIGPGNWKTDSSALFSKVYEGLRFYTDGVNGFVAVDDVVRAMIRLVDQENFGQRFVLVGDNMPYKDVMDLIADGLRVKRPSIRAGRFLSGLAWRMESASSMLTGKRPLITRETAQSAQSVSYYSNKKILSVFPDLITDPRDAIRETASRFLNQDT
ncbi:MAG: NAD-dependent epimerase/dehydratase family protein [Bacteroidota bacterium]|jgi:dihydroflavonol-4-reductase